MRRLSAAHLRVVCAQSEQGGSAESVHLVEARPRAGRARTLVKLRRRQGWRGRRGRRGRRRRGKRAIPPVVVALGHVARGVAVVVSDPIGGAAGVAQWRRRRRRRGKRAIPPVVVALGHVARVVAEVVFDPIGGAAGVAQRRRRGR
eukprot:scaffold97527_cov79-Phaeocystis_antarctica.AAC.6